MEELAGKPVRVFVVWEPVLPTDWTAPSTAALGRISGSRAQQFWDRGRLISHSMGEHNRRSIVWDHIGVYRAGALWNDHPPEALYRGGPVVRVIGPARAAIARALQTQTESF
jgi:hypothetical protein